VGEPSRRTPSGPRRRWPSSSTTRERSSRLAGDKAKHETFGGPEGEYGYDAGRERKLGPPDLRHREGGTIEVAGEEVDDPEGFKGRPTRGRPTDPDAPDLAMDMSSPEQGRGG
jgi:hypothetical protein